VREGGEGESVRGRERHLTHPGLPQSSSSLLSVGVGVGVWVLGVGVCRRRRLYTCVDCVVSAPLSLCEVQSGSGSKETECSLDRPKVGRRRRGNTPTLSPHFSFPLTLSLSLSLSLVGSPASLATSPCLSLARTLSLAPSRHRLRGTTPCFLF
jgi:hypothetical protein